MIANPAISAGWFPGSGTGNQGRSGLFRTDYIPAQSSAQQHQTAALVKWATCLHPPHPALVQRRRSQPENKNGLQAGLMRVRGTGPHSRGARAGPARAASCAFMRIHVRGTCRPRPVQFTPREVSAGPQSAIPAAARHRPWPPPRSGGRTSAAASSRCNRSRLRC